MSQVVAGSSQCRCWRGATRARPLAQCQFHAVGRWRDHPGQVIGATDRRGEEVVSRRVGPQDFLATIYSHLGIDYEKAALPDFTGRPVPIVRDGKAITELVSA